MREERRVGVVDMYKVCVGMDVDVLENFEEVT
jgi:hypothetical protein